MPLQVVSEALTQTRKAAHWGLLILPLSLMVGSATAFFLWGLDKVTEWRFDQPWLLYFLPPAGLAVGFIYHSYGKKAEGGNNLILEQIHEPGGGVPRRMAPLILFSTLLTHLFGGSAGREGTAVQMGGSIASGLAGLFRVHGPAWRVVLMMGVAAGFGAVFGTPIAGAVFALEVLAIGKMQYEALIPCLLCSVLADWTCRGWGIEHAHYRIAFANATGNPFEIQGVLMLKVLAAAVAFGWAGNLFSEMTHSLHAIFKRICPYAPLRPALGGMLILGLVWMVGTREYLGLGVWSPNPSDVTIVALLQKQDIHYWSWWWKMLFTAVTLACGFKGGEVTPLFFVGAALGNALSGIFHAPADLFAALGFVAIFAGATNTPLACTIMGIELFGSAHSVPIALACFVAYLCSGHSGIYLSQRVGVRKTENAVVAVNSTLRQLRENGQTFWQRLVRRCCKK